MTGDKPRGSKGAYLRERKRRRHKDPRLRLALNEGQDRAVNIEIRGVSWQSPPKDRVNNTRRPASDCLLSEVERIVLQQQRRSWYLPGSVVGNKGGESLHPATYNMVRQVR